MNKFAAIILLAAVCQMAIAEPLNDDGIPDGFSETPTEADEEVSLLMGDERIFSDFCVQSHDYVIGDIKTTARETSSRLFTQLFGSANQITEEVLNVQKDAVAQLADQIANPETPIPEGEISENQIAELIAKGRHEIQEKAGLNGIIPGVKAAAEAMLATANSAVMIKLAQLRSYVDPAVLFNGIKSTCDRIANYEKTLSENLEQVKASLASEVAQPELNEFIQSTTVQSLHCKTTKNVVSLNGFCELFFAGKGPFMKMLGLGNSKYAQA